MKRHELEHVLRAAGSITRHDEFLVMGSQAILASHPHAPNELLVSMEVDVCVPDNPDMADLIEGSIGELSPFHDTFGYYAHGLHLESVVLAPGWRDRLIRVESDQTGGVTGWALHPVDIAISKLAAGRPKDIDFVSVMLSKRMIESSDVLERSTHMEAGTARRIADSLARMERS